MPTGNTPLDGIIFTVAERGLDKDIWIAIRTDSVWPGKGTFEYPFKVTTSAEFQTVLTNAAAGSTIHVQPGTYPLLNLTISKSVKITGNRNVICTQITGAGNKPIFSVSGATTEFVLEGIALQHGTEFHNENNKYAIQVTGVMDKIKLLNIFSSDFNNTLLGEFGQGMVVNEAIVRGCDFVYTYGRAGISDVLGAGHPTAPIIGGGMKRLIVQNNTFDGLLDSTFAGITGSPPESAQTPADNFIQTGRHEYVDISDNVIRNFYIEGIRVSRTAGTTGEVHSCRIANNHLDGSTFARGNHVYAPGIVTDNTQSSISGNTISNTIIGINPKWETYDEELNVVSVVGNTLLHVIDGITSQGCSSRSTFANNFIWNTSEPVRTVFGSITKPTNLHGIKISRGTVANNVLLADEPVWDASPTLASRASNVFTLDSVTGIVANTGALVSLDDPTKLSYFPVEGISGNDVTVNAVWAVNYPTITSGTLYYAQNQPSAYGTGGIVVENGGTVYANGNLVIGHRYDINRLNSGTVVTSKHTTRDNHYVQPASANFVHTDNTIFPKFSVSKNANQSIVQNTFTKLTWEVENFDTNDNFASNRFTPTIAGKYLIEATFNMASVTGDIGGFITVYKNGVEYRRGSEADATVGGILSGTVNSLLDMNGTTDYVEVFVYQRDSTTRSVNGSTSLTYFKGAMMP